jgi:hypothetical protein
VKYLACCSWYNRSSILGREYQFVSVILFNSLYSIHILEVSSFLGKIMMGDPQDEALDQIMPCSKHYCNYFFTAFASRLDFLYNSIFSKGESGNNWIMCSTFLFGGIPLGSWNTPLYSFRKSFDSMILSTSFHGWIYF